LHPAGVLQVETLSISRVLSQCAAPRAQLLHDRNKLTPLIAPVLVQLADLAAADEDLAPALR
jgi:hypothetical protein